VKRVVRFFFPAMYLYVAVFIPVCMADGESNVHICMRLSVLGCLSYSAFTCSSEIGLQGKYEKVVLGRSKLHVRY